MLCSLFVFFCQSGSKVRVKTHQTWLQSGNACVHPYIYTHTYAWVCALRWRRSTKGKHTLGLSSTGSDSTCSSIISSNDNADLSRVGITHFPVTCLRGPRLFLYCDRWWTSTLGFWGQGWWGAICGRTPTVRLFLPRIGCLLCTHDSTSSEPVLLYQGNKQQTKTLL